VLDKFGIAVALSSDGSTVALGAPNEDGDPTSTLPDDENENLRDAGAVYVFTRSNASWTETSLAYLKPSRISEHAHFGRSLSLTADGTTLAVGAPFDASAPPAEGAAIIFVRTGSSWFEQTRLGGRTVSEAFGSVKLAPDGLTLFVGVEKDRGLPVAIGTVHVY
jgi:trimeric autotransporter adhesin